MITFEEAREAFAGISMDPDKRAIDTIAEINKVLKSDYDNLRDQLPEDSPLFTDFEEAFQRYKAGFINKYKAFLQSQSRVVSPMIAGPANFPQAQMDKRWKTTHNRMTELNEYRERGIKRMEKLIHPERRPVMSGDDDAIERLKEKIADAEQFQEQAKKCNRIARSKKLTYEDKEAQLEAIGIKPELVKEALNPDYMGCYGFQPWVTNNNNANIRRMKKRLVQLEKYKGQEVKTFELEGDIQIEDDPPANRVRIFFPDKPDADVRNELKKNGFRWAPSVAAWQAYRNQRSMDYAQRMLSTGKKKD